MAKKSHLAFLIIRKETAGQWWLAAIDPDEKEWICNYNSIATGIGVDRGWLCTILIREHGAEMNVNGAIGWTSKEEAEKAKDFILDIYLGKYLAQAG